MLPVPARKPYSPFKINFGNHEAVMSSQYMLAFSRSCSVVGMSAHSPLRALFDTADGSKTAAASTGTYTTTAIRAKATRPQSAPPATATCSSKLSSSNRFEPTAYLQIHMERSGAKRHWKPGHV